MNARILLARHRWDRATRGEGAGSVLRTRSLAVTGSLFAAVMAACTSPARSDRAPAAADLAPPLVRATGPRTAAPGSAERHSQQRVSLSCKGAALSEVCDILAGATGAAFSAQGDVADEKMTIFCRDRPLTEITRELAGPFGYVWLIGGTHGRPRYELAEGLEAHLAEERLRVRDRDAALGALGRAIDRYRPFLSLSPDEARTRAATADPATRDLLSQLAGPAWALGQLYARLSPEDLAALRAGHVLVFSPEPQPGQHLLPQDVARGVLQTQRDFSLSPHHAGFALGKGEPGDTPLTAGDDAVPLVTLMLTENGPGQVVLSGGVGFTVGCPASLPLAAWREAAASYAFSDTSTFAVGDPKAGYMMTHSVLATSRDDPEAGPEGWSPHPALPTGPAMRRLVTIRPRPCNSADRPPEGAAQTARVSVHSSPLDQGGPQSQTGDPPTAMKVTTADVLEAIHRASGLSVVGDFYTRLYPVGEVTAVRLPLYAALDQLARAMNAGWSTDGSWVRFRSRTFYDDRLQEVPNRLLAGWQESSRKNGGLTPDDLIAISRLSDAQLDADGVAEGVKACWQLAEWNLARSRHLRPHLRFLGSLSEEQRRQAMSPKGLPFGQLNSQQQQQFLLLADGSDGELAFHGPGELAGSTLRVLYVGATGRGGHPSAAAPPPSPPASSGQPPRSPEPGDVHPARTGQSPAVQAVGPDLRFVYTVAASNEPTRRFVVSAAGGGVHAAL